MRNFFGKGNFSQIHKRFEILCGILVIQTQVVAVMVIKIFTFTLAQTRWAVCLEQRNNPFVATVVAISVFERVTTVVLVLVVVLVVVIAVVTAVADIAVAVITMETARRAIKTARKAIKMVAVIKTAVLHA